MLVAWPSLALDPMMALTAQWVGFTALWWADAKATNHGWGTFKPMFVEKIAHSHANHSASLVFPVSLLLVRARRYLVCTI